MRNRRFGMGAVLAMSVVALLAHGLPGFGDSPAQAYVDEEVSRMLAADAKLFPIGPPVDEAEELPSPMTRIDKKRVRKARKAGPYTVDYRKIAYKAAKDAGIKRPGLFVRQIAAESGFNPCVRSGAGAIGIAQIMPDTARSWKVDPYMPVSALQVAAKKMARYEKQYGSYSLALAAYNAGPGAVAEYGGIPPYEETRNYVYKITHTSVDLLGMQQVYRLPGGFQSGFRQRLERLQKEVRRRGGHIRVNSGWRSYEEQVILWRNGKKKYGGWQNTTRWVAPPGCSNHNKGWAADLEGNLRLAHELAPRFGLVFPLSNEPWHIEKAGIPTQSG